MDCCAIQGTDRFFSRWSRAYGKRFRRKGLTKEQKYLVEGITKHPVKSKTVLDIGSGVGALHLTLLQMGAAHAVGIDIAEGMIEQAKKFAKEQGLSDRTKYIVGDFVATNGEIPVSDITMLDKVVCCYENVDDLLVKSLGKTKELCALSFPRNVFPVRTMFEIQIFIAKLFRWSFRPFWHDWEAICAKIRAGGFEETYHNNTIVWSVRVYRRL